MTGKQIDKKGVDKQKDRLNGKTRQITRNIDKQKVREKEGQINKQKDRLIHARNIDKQKEGQINKLYVRLYICKYVDRQPCRYIIDMLEIPIGRGVYIQI